MAWDPEDRDGPGAAVMIEGQGQADDAGCGCLARALNTCHHGLGVSEEGKILTLCDIMLIMLTDRVHKLSTLAPQHNTNYKEATQAQRRGFS